MGEEFTTGEVKKMILDLTCLLGEEGGENAELNEKVLLRLLAFIAMEPAPEGMEELSDSARYTCIRALETIRKRETTGAETKKNIFLVLYLLRELYANDLIDEAILNHLALAERYRNAIRYKHKPKTVPVIKALTVEELSNNENWPYHDINVAFHEHGMMVLGIYEGQPK